MSLISCLRSLRNLRSPVQKLQRQLDQFNQSLSVVAVAQCHTSGGKMGVPMMMELRLGGQPHRWISNHSNLKDGRAFFAAMPRPAEPEPKQGGDGGGSAAGDDAAGGKGKPNRDHLHAVHNLLVDSLNNFFAKPMNYKVYRTDIELIDNIRGKRTVGIQAYISQAALLRMAGHFKFAYVKFHILQTDISEEDGRITIRWTIKGITGLQVFLKFWKYRLWDWKGVMNRAAVWYDGVSYFDVGDDGLIYRHIADKVIEDKERLAVAVKPDKAILAAKLGLLTSLYPESSLSYKQSSEQPQEKIRAEAK